MILSVLEKTEDAFHFTSAKTGSGFYLKSPYDFTLNSVTVQDILNSLWN